MGALYVAIDVRFVSCHDEQMRNGKQKKKGVDIRSIEILLVFSYEDYCDVKCLNI